MLVCNLLVKTLHHSYKLGTPLQFLSIPCCNERLKTYFKGVKNVSEVSFTTFEEILSYVGLLLDFKILKASFTSSSVRFASPVKVCCRFRYWSNFAYDSEIIEASFGPMSAKKLLNQFAIFP